MLAVLPGIADAQVREDVVLPFVCKVDGGQVRLEPSKDRNHAILGRRQETTVMACDGAEGGNCRTLVVHSFTLACGGQRVAWADVALAIGGRRTSRVTRADGRLHVTIVDHAAVEGSRCEEEGTPGTAPGSGEARVQPIAMVPCRSERTTETRFVMPPGFAPLAHFGGRIVPRDAGRAADALDAAAAAPSPPPNRRVTVATGRPRSEESGVVKKTISRHPLERTIITEALPDIAHGTGSEGPLAPEGLASDPRAASTLATGAVASDDRAPSERLAWSATVHPAGTQQPVAMLASSGGAAQSTQLLTWMLLTTTIAASGLLVWRRPLVVQRAGAAALERMAGLLRIAAPVLNAWTARQPRSATNADGFPASGIERLLDEVSREVSRPETAAALRAVLEDELRRVRQRLAVARAASEAPGELRLPAAHYRVLIRDLERIRRIAASAGPATSAASAPSRIPQNPAEAYEVLGINASVDEPTVKKVVEALRRSWHPDLAADDADRDVRTERIKQINVAAELILSRRSAI